MFVAVPDASTFSDRLFRWVYRENSGHINPVFARLRRLRPISQAPPGLASSPLCAPSVLPFEYLNRYYFPARTSWRLRAVGNGNRRFIVWLSYAARLFDRVFQARASSYGWAFYFGNIGEAVEQGAWSATCMRRGWRTRACCPVASREEPGAASPAILPRLLLSGLRLVGTCSHPTNETPAHETPAQLLRDRQPSGVRGNPVLAYDQSLVTRSRIEWNLKIDLIGGAHETRSETGKLGRGQLVHSTLPWVLRSLEPMVRVPGAGAPGFPPAGSSLPCPKDKSPQIPRPLFGRTVLGDISRTYTMLRYYQAVGHGCNPQLNHRSKCQRQDGHRQRLHSALRSPGIADSGLTRRRTGR